MVLNKQEKRRLPSTLARSPEKAQDTYMHTLEAAVVVFVQEEPGVHAAVPQRAVRERGVAFLAGAFLTRAFSRALLTAVGRAARSARPAAARCSAIDASR